MITRALEDYKMITSRSNQAAPAASDFASERSGAKSLGEGRADRGTSDFASERSGAKSLGEGRAGRRTSDFTSERFEGKTAEAAGLVLRGFGFRFGTVRNESWGW